ncbi:MAG: hypothetical protein QOG67_2547 [Verrucomicrobiota bacterium]|jgi:hypothetical protein
MQKPRSTKDGLTRKRSEKSKADYDYTATDVLDDGEFGFSDTLLGFAKSCSASFESCYYVDVRAGSPKITKEDRENGELIRRGAYVRTWRHYFKSFEQALAFFNSKRSDEGKYSRGVIHFGWLFENWTFNGGGSR